MLCYKKQSEWGAAFLFQSAEIDHYEETISCSSLFILSNHNSKQIQKMQEQSSPIKQFSGNQSFFYNRSDGKNSLHPFSYQQMSANLAVNNEPINHLEHLNRFSPFSDSKNKKQNKGLLVTTSRRLLHRKQMDEEGQQQRPKSSFNNREVSINHKEVDVLRNQVSFMRKRLTEAENLSKKLQFQLELLKATYQGNPQAQEKLFSDPHHKALNNQTSTFLQDHCQKEQRPNAQISFNQQEERKTHDKIHHLLTEIDQQRQKNRNLEVELEEMRIKKTVMEEKLESNQLRQEQSQKLLSSLNQKCYRYEDEIRKLKNLSSQLELNMRRANEQIQRLTTALKSSNINQKQVSFNQEFESMKVKMTQYHERATSIDVSINNINSFISNFKEKGERMVNNTHSDIQIIDQFRLKHKQLQQLLQRLIKQPK